MIPKINISFFRKTGVSSVSPKWRLTSNMRILQKCTPYYSGDEGCQEKKCRLRAVLFSLTGNSQPHPLRKRTRRVSLKQILHGVAQVKSTVCHQWRESFSFRSVRHSRVP